jgi:hypothetical protein
MMVTRIPNETTPSRGLGCARRLIWTREALKAAQQVAITSGHTGWLASRATMVLKNVEGRRRERTIRSVGSRSEARTEVVHSPIATGVTNLTPDRRRGTDTMIGSASRPTIRMTRAKIGAKGIVLPIGGPNDEGL